VALPTILTETVHNTVLSPSPTRAPLLPTLWPTEPLLTGAGVGSRTGAEYARRVTSRNTTRSRLMVARTTVCNIVNPGDVLSLDPWYQVLYLMGTAWWDLETELVDSLDDGGEVGGVDQGGAQLLLITDITSSVG